MPIAPPSAESMDPGTFAPTRLRMPRVTTSREVTLEQVAADVRDLYEFLRSQLITETIDKHGPISLPFTLQCRVITRPLIVLPNAWRYGMLGTTNPDIAYWEPDGPGRVLVKNFQPYAATDERYVRFIVVGRA